MKDRKIKIGFIGSTDQFINSCFHVARRFDIDALYAKSAIEDAIPEAEWMIDEGVETIISWRGTGYLLSRKFSIPVLSTRISYLDFITSIKEASVFGKTILLTSFVEEAIETDILEGLLGVKIVVGKFHDSRSLENTILWGKAGGCDVVIGGGYSMRIAEQHGMQYSMMKITQEAVKSCINDAISVVQSRRKGQRENAMYQAIMDATTEGVIAAGSDGIITNVNKAARDFLKGQDGLEGTHLSDIMPKSVVAQVIQERQPQRNRIVTIGGETVLANYVPLIEEDRLVGTVTTFKDISHVTHAEHEVRRSFKKKMGTRYTFDDLIYRSPPMKALISRAQKYALSDSTILITGETGTGKEMLAQSIHASSTRQQGPFVSINCAAVPDQLLESELFGYEEGAFTGSRRGGRPGLFELAHRGTIFLDEIGLTPLTLQNRLLRVLQEREVMRVGGDRLIPVDVRVLASTNKDLSDEIWAGRFREDLFFRLNVLTLSIPPLRERSDDIPVLVTELAGTASRYYDTPPLNIPAVYIEKIQSLDWPGNVRQLENFIEKLVILSDGRFSAQIFCELHTDLVNYSLKMKKDVSERVETGERQARADANRGGNDDALLYRALLKNRFNKANAARDLGISRTTLWRRMKAMEKDVTGDDEPRH